jgi:uncharacterized LabA/DUF88 family protein
MRVRIFVDFWNLQLAWNYWHTAQGSKERVKIPWKNGLSDVLVKHVAAEAMYMGTHVYASVDPTREADKRLRGFLHVMDGFPGYKVLVKDRKPRSAVRCPNDQCGKKITDCPHCGQEIRGTVEKGIDTAIVVDLIQGAADRTYDRAVLVSGDADFVPAVEFIQRGGTQIIHAHFRNQANQIMNACWDHLFFDDLMDELLAE